MRGSHSSLQIVLTYAGLRELPVIITSLLLLLVLWVLRLLNGTIATWSLSCFSVSVKRNLRTIGTVYLASQDDGGDYDEEVNIWLVLT